MKCPANDGWKLETFDLYEGRSRGYSYASNVGDPLKYATQLGLKVDKALPKKYRGVATRVQLVDKSMFFNKPGEVLRFTGDTSETAYVGEGCELLQTVVFRRSSDIEVSYDNWHAIDGVSQAALYLHEALYWYFRTGGGEGDSRRTRAAVSYLMAGGKLEAVDAFPYDHKGKIQHCHSRRYLTDEGGWSTEFYAYFDGNGYPMLQFLSAGGYRMITRTTIRGGRREEIGANQGVIDLMGKAAGIMGIARSKLDQDSNLTVNWNRRDGITLSGKIQSESLVTDEIECVDYKP
jgi:hypothetical protein